MTETLVNWFSTHLGGFLSPELLTFVISMVPILELRGGLIAARLFGIPYLQALLLCVAGNIVPIPFIIWALTPVCNLLKKTKLFRPLVEWFEKKAEAKSDRVRKAEFLGLVLFVGIPLPGTGAWTGGFIASMLGIKPKKAIPAILCGLVLAAAIMSFITYALPAIIALF